MLAGSMLLTGSLVVAGCSASPKSPAGTAVVKALAVPAITVTDTECGDDWSAQPAGEQRYVVQDDGSASMRVSLVNADSGGIYAQVFQISPHTSVELTGPVPAGNYRWRCVPLTGGAAVSPVRAVTGDGAAGTKPLIPMTADEIDAAVSDYRTLVTSGLAKLATDTDALGAAVAAGDFEAAKARWLTAHLDYERLGAAYGTFGDFADEIDGRCDGLADGAADPQFRGFLRVEYALWHDQPPSVITSVTAALDSAVHQLVAKFPDEQINAADIPLRAHEILENTLQFELTDDTDEGSHTTLATARANVDGTKMVFGVVKAMLERRDPDRVTRIDQELDSLAAKLESFDHSGSWPSVRSLPQAQRESLDASIDALLEELAPVPDILQMPPSTAPT
jgi:high-affinity iron transporter